MNQDDEKTRDGLRITWVGALVNAALIVLKATAGILGGSHALIADAVHSFSDFFTDAVVIWGLIHGRKRADDDHHFGHGRIETLASFLVAVSLLGVALFLGWQAGIAIQAHLPSRPTWLAVTAAGVSILGKELLYHYTVRVGREIRSTAVIANAWHHRSDALSSVAVLFGVLAARVHPDWHMADSYAALIVAAFIFHVGVRLLAEAIREFTDAAPERDTIDRIVASAVSVEGVHGVHDLRVRLTGGLLQMEIHVEVDGDISVIEGHHIGDEVQRRVESDLENVARMIIHVDPWDDREIGEAVRRPPPDPAPPASSEGEDR